MARLQRSLIVRVIVEKDGIRVVDFRHDSVWIASTSRAVLYSNGIQERLQDFLASYCLTVNHLKEAEVVLDVGANCGELGILAERVGASYIAFEPDPQAYKSLVRNVNSKDVFGFALGDFDGSSTFCVLTDDADSTVLPVPGAPVIEIEMRRLDGFLNEMGFQRKIGLLKVEAEGFEPEVLIGAEGVLSKVQRVAVDAGPERAGQSTFPEVANFLSQHRFSLEACNLARGRFLFRAD